jgi:hypothetical protein
MKQSDHDILLTFRGETNTTLEDIKRQVRELRDGTITRISSLERDKADKDIVEQLQDKLNRDIEVRVRKVETSISRFLIITGIYSAIGLSLIGLIIYHITHTPQ